MKKIEKLIAIDMKSTVKSKCTLLVAPVHNTIMNKCLS